MNTDSFNVGTSDKTTPPPITEADGSQNIIPPGLEFFEQLKGKSHASQLALALPPFANALKACNMEVIQGFAGIFWGVGFDLDVPLPIWVKTASVNYWKASGFDFLKEIEKGEPKEIGKLVELLELTPNENEPTELEKATRNLAQLIKTDSGNLPAAKLKEYADARISIPKLIENAKQPAQRTKVILTIAGAWPQIQKLQSAGQLHKWLIDNQVIVPSTDAAETRKICRMLKIPFASKAGRPPKPKSGH